jgi:hypothetical protein
MMTLPFEGSTLGTSATFYWTAGIGVTRYMLHVGTTAGGADISNQDRGTNLSATVSGLPAGTVVYARLWSLIGTWQFRDYVYNFTPAAYNPDLWAPKCALPVAGCSSDTLLTGKGTIASEPHQPNTILNSCTDGTSGAFHLSESIDTMRISTLDGGVFMPGKTVRVEADVWAQSPSDFLYFYRTSDATIPSWTLLASIAVPDNGPQTLSATYVLPLGNLQAVRGVFRSSGAAISCGPGAFDDNDDLVFATASLPASMVSPANGTTLASSSQTFSWNTGAGVTQYILWVGTTGAGSKDIAMLDRGTNLSANVTGLPVNGSTIYVRLWSLTDAWEFRDYTYTAFGTSPAAITNPANGSTLTSSSQTFDWNAGGGATQYVIWAGTTGAGSNNIAAIDRGMNLNAIITGLPTNGSTIYVRLWSLIAGNWLFRDYTYTAVTASSPATITSPSNGSTLTSSSQTFDWNAGGGATQYVIWAGANGAGSNNITAMDRGGNLNATITGLPVDGSTIYVRLWSLIGASWEFIDYTYTAVTASSPAAITSPTNGSTLASSSQTFSWDAGSGAVQYVIWVGTTGAGSQDIVALDRGMNQSATVTGLPTTGVTIYVRLWSLVVGGWQFRDYTYTAAGP